MDANKRKTKRCTYRRKIAVVVVTKKGKNGKRGATYATSYYVPVSKNRKGKSNKLETKVEVKEDPIDIDPVPPKREPTPEPQVRKPVPED